ncbi:MAG: peptidase [Neomegalonema sp.]|nr:peptidase [Neomegalonema sp.]
MTYCLALNLNDGLVLLADSRTNAGVDNISTFGKLFTWSMPQSPEGNGRAIALMMAGNLSITQEIVNLIEEENARGDQFSIMQAPSMFRVAERVGALMSDVQGRRGPALFNAGVAAGASIIVAGQIQGDVTRVFLVYTEGNFIEATADTPFMQIGEAKYGKPILDRTITMATPMNEGITAALLSMDATLRSNLSVGMPLDMAVSSAGSFEWRSRRIGLNDATYRDMSNRWSEHLRSGFKQMPLIEI